MGQACEEVRADRERGASRKRSFKKCGIAMAVDGSEDSEINISESEEYAEDENDDGYTDDEDPFADCD